MNKHKFFVIILILILLTTFTGCWGRTELNYLGVVLLTGVDFDPDDSLYEVTVQIMKNRPNAGQKGDTGSSEDIWTASAKGINLSESFKNLRARAPLSLNWEHSTILVLGKVIAENKLLDIMDFFTRNRQIRISAHVLITDSTAREVLSTEPEADVNLASQLRGMIRNRYDYGKVEVVTLKDVVLSVLNPRINFITSKVVMLNTDKPKGDEAQGPGGQAAKSESQGEEGKDENTEVLVFDGAGVFKEDKLVGWLTPNEVQGYNYLTARNYSSVISVLYKDSNLALQINHIQSKIKPQYQDGQFYIDVIVDAKGYFMEENIQENILDPQVIESIHDAVSSQMEKEIRHTLDVSQTQLNTDIFNLGDDIYRKYPKEWHQIETNWNNIYPGLQVNLKVTVDIEFTQNALNSVNYLKEK